jgi:hypothetical protein
MRPVSWGGAAGSPAQATGLSRDRWHFYMVDHSGAALL